MDRGASADQILQAAAALFNSFTFEKLIPTVALLLMAGLLLYMLRKAQLNLENKFDFGDFFRDDTKSKVSFKYLVGFLCFMVHTWVIFTSKLDNKLTFNDMLLYGTLWSGTATAMYALNIWRGISTPPAPAETHPPAQG
jgi:hypothetical protein